MFALKSAFRQIASATRHLEIKHLSTGSRPEKTEAFVRVLDRVNYFVWNNYPSRALAYFHNELSSGRVPIRERSDVYDAVVRVFVQNGLLNEARNVLDRLETSEHVLSVSLYATVTTHEFLTGKIKKGTFLKKIEIIITSPRYNERKFVGLLNHLFRMGCSTELMDEVSSRYIRTKALGPEGVSTLIQFLLQKNDLLRAERWITYHCEQLHSRRDRITESDSAPYTSYMQGLLAASKSTEPVSIYLPILKQMLEDGAWPDINYFNYAMEAETRIGNLLTALRVYNTIHSFIDRGVLPTDGTYAPFFTRMMRDSKEHDPEKLRPISRDLFYEMMTVHAVASERGRLPVATSVSLSTAMLMFTATEDYAAACRALRAHKTYHCPLPELMIRKIVTTLVTRCYHSLRLEQQGPSTSWVIAFMGLGSEARRRHFRNAPVRDIHRRVLDVGRHNFSLPDTPKDDEPPPGDDSVPGASSVSKRSPVRERKIKRMRENKLEFVHTLLLRALAATFALDGVPMDRVQRLTKEALLEAEKTMSPTIADIKKSKFAECPKDT